MANTIPSLDIDTDTWGDAIGRVNLTIDVVNDLAVNVEDLDSTKFDNPSGNTSQYVRGNGTLATFPSIPAGTVTSVAASVPTGFSIAGSPVTSSGTLAITYSSGYEGFTTALKNLVNSAVQPGDLSAVAISGDYDDLSNTPSLFSGDYGDLDNKPSNASTSTAGFMSASDKEKLDGVASGANVTNASTVGSSIHGVSAKTTPVDADTLPLIDSAASNGLKKATWANIKATLKSYFDTLYAAVSHSHGLSDLGNGTAVSIVGRSANSSGVRADIAAGANDRLLARVGNALDWVQLTIGMIPDALVTYAKLASAAVATFTEFNSATGSKLLSNGSVWSALVALTDGATIAVDMNLGFDFTVTINGNRTLGAASNVRSTKKGVIWVSATGATRTLTLNAAWVLADGVETGPYSITTSQRLGIAYACDGTTVVVTGIVRY